MSSLDRQTRSEILVTPMAPLSSYQQLPLALQVKIDALIHEEKFANYSELSQRINQLLEGEGYEQRFSRSALHRHGQKLKEVVDKVRASHEAAKIIQEAYPEEEEQLSQATIRLVQERLFSILLEMNDSAQPISPKDLAAIGRAVSDITRANVSDRKYRAEVQARAQVAVTEAQSIATRGGLSPEAAEQIQQLILGVVG